MVSPRESTVEVRRRENLPSEGRQLGGALGNWLGQWGWISSKGAFESYKCYILEKRKSVFNIAKDAFSKTDSGILRNPFHPFYGHIPEIPGPSRTHLFRVGVFSLLRNRFLPTGDATNTSTMSFGLSCLARICCSGSGLWQWTKSIGAQAYISSKSIWLLTFYLVS